MIFAAGFASGDPSAWSTTINPEFLIQMEGHLTILEGNLGPTRAVGGEIIPIEATSLILAGAQSFSWMIPVVLSIVGIGLFLVRKK